jgi:hypothetical protein
MRSSSVRRRRGSGASRRRCFAYNADAIHVLEALGQMTWKHRGREVELTIDLPEVEAAARVRPLLWQFAIGAVDPGRSLLERLWPRRRAALGGPVRT